jgi:hypothetical protein
VAVRGRIEAGGQAEARSSPGYCILIRRTRSESLRASLPRLAGWAFKDSFFED